MKNYNYSELEVAYLANGTKLNLPIHEIQGEHDGPTIGITASIHGDEIIGIEIIRQLITILKQEEITGTIKLISVSNPLAFEAVHRNTPIDGGNLNRAFPGNKDGLLTAILAHKISENFLSSLDVYIDLHSGGRDPIVDYVYILNDEELSRMFGSKVLYRPDKMYEGTSGTYTCELGIPSTVIEIGGGPNYLKYIERGVKGTLNMLKCKKAISGNTDPLPKQYTVDSIENITPHHGGLFVPSFEFGQMNQIIEGHQTLAKIYNPLTLELVEEIKAPFDKNLIILMRGYLNRVHAGDYSFMISDASKAEVK